MGGFVSKSSTQKQSKPKTKKDLTQKQSKPKTKKDLTQKEDVTKVNVNLLRESLSSFETIAKNLEDSLRLAPSQGNLEVSPNKLQKVVGDISNKLLVLRQENSSQKLKDLVTSFSQVPYIELYQDISKFRDGRTSFNKEVISRSTAFGKFWRGIAATVLPKAIQDFLSALRDYKNHTETPYGTNVIFGVIYTDTIRYVQDTIVSSLAVAGNETVSSAVAGNETMNLSQWRPIEKLHTNITQNPYQPEKEWQTFTSYIIFGEMVAKYLVYIIPSVYTVYMSLPGNNPPTIEELKRLQSNVEEGLNKLCNWVSKVNSWLSETYPEQITLLPQGQNEKDDGKNVSNDTTGTKVIAIEMDSPV